MATTSRSSNSIGGAQGQGTWADQGQGGLIVTKAAVSVPAAGNDETIIFLAPKPNIIVPTSAGGSQGYGAFDPPPAAGAPLWGLYAIWITAGPVAIPINMASLQLVANLWRAGAVIGGGPIAGWAAAANPAVAPFTTIQMPFAVGAPTLAANTAIQPGPNGNVGNTGLFGTCWLPLQPQDIITIKALNSSGGALPINVFTATTTVV